jgi:DNA helicase-2/ATP-dependent DNA helicase PcrA
VLITAGPGTGKTFTLVQRSLYLIQEKGIKPEEILVATFTEKAAKELITRISNTLLKKGILLNLNEMYIGTFHSICLRFIKENLEYSNIKKITVPWMTLTRNIPSCEKCVFSKK